MISNNKMFVPGLLAIMIQINITTTPYRLWVGAIVRVQSHLAPKGDPRASYQDQPTPCSPNRNTKGIRQHLCEQMNTVNIALGRGSKSRN